MKPELPNRSTDNETGFSRWSQSISLKSQKHHPLTGRDTTPQLACHVWDKQPCHNAALISEDSPQLEFAEMTPLNSNSMPKQLPTKSEDSNIDLEPLIQRLISIRTSSSRGALSPGCSANLMLKFIEYWQLRGLQMRHILSSRQLEQDLDHNDPVCRTIIRHFQSQLITMRTANFEEITVKFIYRLELDSF